MQLKKYNYNNIDIFINNLNKNIIGFKLEKIYKNHYYFNFDNKNYSLKYINNIWELFCFDFNIFDVIAIYKNNFDLIEKLESDLYFNI